MKRVILLLLFLFLIYPLAAEVLAPQYHVLYSVEPGSGFPLALSAVFALILGALFIFFPEGYLSVAFLLLLSFFVSLIYLTLVNEFKIKAMAQRINPFIGRNIYDLDADIALYLWLYVRLLVIDLLFISILHVIFLHSAVAYMFFAFVINALFHIGIYKRFRFVAGEVYYAYKYRTKGKIFPLITLLTLTFLLVNSFLIVAAVVMAK